MYKHFKDGEEKSLLIHTAHPAHNTALPQAEKSRQYFFQLEGQGTQNQGTFFPSSRSGEMSHCASLVILTEWNRKVQLCK